MFDKQKLNLRIARLKAYFLATRRRISKTLLMSKTDLYEKNNFSLSPSLSHRSSINNIKPKLSFLETSDRFQEFSEWQKIAREKLSEICGVQPIHIMESQSKIEESSLDKGLICEKYYLKTTAGYHIPVHLIFSNKVRIPKRAMICLQGTNSGAHLSLGKIREPADFERLQNGADFALQAAEKGWLAVAIEQSCFGERREQLLEKPSQDPCIDAANHALMIGNTLIGERVTDVNAVVDWLKNERLNKRFFFDTIVCLGHSSGGSTAMFSVALNEKIDGVIASGCIGYMRQTIMLRGNPSGQNIVPGILKWFEMNDIIAMCAPRPTITISGVNDHIWPSSGMSEVCSSARLAFEKMGAEDKLCDISVLGKHKFYPEETWSAVEEIFS
tara:strand:+ start:40706 stop:41863 length:1158 start_codon:yes stop_codon:yes gene_type:complete